MNILLINGSPKGEQSNTLKLANAFLDGIKDATKDIPPHIEIMNIAAMDIRSCLGCFSCWKTTPGKCVIQDDMSIILEKLLWADVTIWSFPLYYFSLPGKLKMTMDRQLPLSLPYMASDTESGGHPSRYDMTGKSTVVISTCGFHTVTSNYDSVIAQFNRLCGKDGYTAIFCAQGELFRVPGLAQRTNEYLAIVRQAGQEYASGKISDETANQLKEPLFPQDVYEQMADASWGIADNGKKDEDSLIFTKQMAALYDPSSYPGHDIIFDMDYTDIGKRYRITLGQSKNEVSETLDGSPATVIRTPFSVWQEIASGKLEGSEALMKRLYTVQGDFSLLMQWDTYFGQSKTKGAHQPTNQTQKTDMRNLLIPWITFWVSASIDLFWGALISIVITSILPLFIPSNKTRYDQITFFLVNLLSAIAIITEIPDIILPLSYCLFGTLWCISAWKQSPLTACYSMYDYGGETALKNPIFMKTNSILTIAWGILYLLTSLWTYFLMRTELSGYTGLINSILPLFMGMFTKWFQKWYPAKIAKG